MSDSTYAAVIGGGVTGLALGYHLHKAAIPHVVLESTDRVGGVIRSGRVEDHLLEWGPQRTRLTPIVRELIQTLALDAQLVSAPAGLPLFVFRSGKLREVPLTLAALVRSDIVPARAKLRLLLEPLTSGARPEESVAGYFTRKLGRSLYENVAGPLYGGLYASDPANMIVGLSLRHALEEMGIGRSLLVSALHRRGSAAVPPACSFCEGMETLPRALQKANAPNVYLEAGALAMRRVGGRWEIETEAGTLRAERVVITVPAAVAARLLGGESESAIEPLRRLVYNPLVVVHLQAETGLRGLGYQVSLAERMVTRGVTFNDSLFQRKGVYTAFLGGAKVPEVVGWSDGELGTVATREFRQVTGYESRPLSIARVSMPAWDRSWAGLSNLALPPGVRLATNWESRPGLPGRLVQAKRVAQELARDFGAAALDRTSYQA